jgi:ABC-type polysaccharide transport system permease subunit
MEKLIKVKGMNRRRRAEKVFYWMMLALPLLQFCVFYIAVNFNSILLSFQSIETDISGGGYIYSWVGFENFSEVIRLCLNEYELVCSFSNSLMAYGIGLVFGSFVNIKLAV